jgi:hypothetical protein
MRTGEREKERESQKRTIRKGQTGQDSHERLARTPICLERPP